MHRHILREDMYRQAVDLLPVVLQDMGNLVERNVEGDDKDTTLTVTKCAYSELLTQVRQASSQDLGRIGGRSITVLSQ